MCLVPYLKNNLLGGMLQVVPARHQRRAATKFEFRALGTRHGEGEGCPHHFCLSGNRYIFRKFQMPENMKSRQRTPSQNSGNFPIPEWFVNFRNWIELQLKSLHNFFLNED